MDNFFKNLTGGDSSKNKKTGGSRLGSSSKKKQDGQPFKKLQESFANLGQNMTGGGGSAGSKKPSPGIVGGGRLGGSKPGTLHTLTFDQPGSLGLKVENTQSGGCIVSHIVPNGQADRVGCRRGDVICIPGAASGGSPDEEEMKFEHFLALAASDRRPLTVQVRRVAGTGGGGGAESRPSGKSAAADARREAVIAAAEERERKHKEKTRPRTAAERRATNAAAAATKKTEEEQEEEESPPRPMSEETRQAIAAAKHDEAATAASLGYNPYEVAKMGHGQAQAAVSTKTHGAMKDHVDHIPTSSPADAVPPNNEVAARQPLETLMEGPEHIDEAFDEAYVVVTSQDDAKSSVGTMRKLIVNATTKGQHPGDEGEKFRRVRLSNPRIKSAIVDVRGALDLMLSCGFELYEQSSSEADGGEGGETFLVYPVDRSVPAWISHAIDRMAIYEKET